MNCAEAGGEDGVSGTDNGAATAVDPAAPSTAHPVADAMAKLSTADTTCGLAKTERQLAKEKAAAEKRAKLESKLKVKAKVETKKSMSDQSAVNNARDARKRAAEGYQELTPIGEKKVLQGLEHPALKAYNPLAVESAWYSWWEKKGFFSPQLTLEGQIKPQGVFVVTVPPPNVTGKLHIGHALTIAIEDTLVRWNRMLGKTVLYVPGFDHAGISTQSVVEKRLWVDHRQTRHDVGREELVKLVWKWKDDFSQKINHQLRRLGGSFDWSRQAFTMDEKRSRAVVEHFVRLHDEGAIYRANRLVNWCCHLQTTLSNLEVEQKEISGRTLLHVPGYADNERVEFGVLTSFAYQVVDSSEKIIVATTRPETMLGDTAVAVHPDDARYRHLHGRFVQHPFLERKLPIITDSHVEMDFGTGAVKITPAHDPNDCEMGKRHGLSSINILNNDGTFNENCGDWKGFKRFHVRRSIIEKLKEKDLYIGQVDNPMVLPMCTKTGDIIEPLIKPQWWVRQKEMAQTAIESVQSGRIKIRPSVSEQEFYRWMESITDWCISRQIWWGHRIPAYLVEFHNDSTGIDEDDRWVCGRDLEEANQRATAKYSGMQFTLKQDEDVLDTWFSSALWPFSTLGWPEETDDLKKYYPTSLLETGWDILFFWVARMIMLGIKLTGNVPFEEVYCHSLIRDAHGRKMSKSLGNVIDPTDVIQGISLQDLHAKLLTGNLDQNELKRAKASQAADFPKGIPECGSDALRFALCAYTTGGRDLNLDILRVEGYRKFCNKIYQAVKFALFRLGDDFIPRTNCSVTGKESLVERWILNQYNMTAKSMNSHLEDRNFLDATSAIYRFWLNEFCDVYIETSKQLIISGTEREKRSAQDTLYTCLDGALRMISPFMPFLTEELWQRLPRRPGDETETICLASYPVFEEQFCFSEAADRYGTLLAIVKQARSVMAANSIVNHVNLAIETTDPDICSLVECERFSIIALVKNCETVRIEGDNDVAGTPYRVRVWSSS